MKKFLITLCALPSIVILLLGWGNYSYAQSGKNNPPVDSMIRLTRINAKVIMLGVGADAITAIATQKGIVVIDAGISGTLTSHYRKIIEKEFQRNDFACVINTHGHHDHTYGNIAFTEAKIIAHENSIKEINDRWSDTAKVRSNLLSTVKQYDEMIKGLEKGSPDWKEAFSQRTRYHSAYKDAVNNVTVRYPDVLFSDTLKLSMGDATLDMIWFGKAHSESDIIIHIPEMKLFFVGDLFSKYGRPSFDTLDKQEWNNYRKAIDWIESRSSINDIVINGHGQIMNNTDLDNFISVVRKKTEALEFKLYYNTNTIK
jgi:cyclase